MAMNLETLAELNALMSKPGHALASPNVSDVDVLEAVKRLDMPPSQRPALWKARWDNSAALQREFIKVEYYVSFMEAAAVGRVRILGKAPV